MSSSPAPGQNWKRRAGIALALLVVVTVLGFVLPRPGTASTRKISFASAVSAPDSSSVVVRIATYNVRNYNSIPRRDNGDFRPDWPKPEAEKTALRAVIVEAHPDVLALQEMGNAPYLEELRRDLAAEGLTYTYSAIVNGPDPDRHVAVLSRLEPVRVNALDNVTYKFNGAAEPMKRGLLEISFVTQGHPWTLDVLHLKSRITEIASDPNGVVMREAEARAARDLIRKDQLTTVDALVAVVGDFNDVRNSPPVKRFLDLSGRPLLLIAPAVDTHGETWTEYYSAGEQYSRSDYILLSPALAAFQKNPGGVVDISESRKASDHRLVWVDLMFPSAKE